MSNSLKLLRARLGIPKGEYMGPEATNDGINRLSGFSQQERMIKDKRRTLDRAVLYSYQGAVVKKIFDPLNSLNDLTDEGEEIKTYRALINSNKLKPDYDDKIISVGFEAGFKCGDVFEWENTHTYWLIYNQNLTELAYFKGEIRKCDCVIKWYDDNGDIQSCYAAIRGPVETRINAWQKDNVEYNSPNWSLNILIPKTAENVAYFQRYRKIYISNGVKNHCWQVEAVDAYRLDNVIEFTAVEYYDNEYLDDIENGIVNGKEIQRTKAEIINPSSNLLPGTPLITGESIIKAKRSYNYFFTGAPNNSYGWYSSCNSQLSMKPITDDAGHPGVQIKWNQTYENTFKIWYGDKTNSQGFEKTIKAKALF